MKIELLKYQKSYDKSFNLILKLIKSVYRAFVFSIIDIDLDLRYIGKELEILHILYHDLEKDTVVVKVSEELYLRSEGISLGLAGLGAHLKASLFKVKFDEGIDEGIECFVNRAVLVD